MSTALASEWRKTRRAPVARIAAAGVLALVPATSIGGYAAAVHAPTTDVGRKAAAMITHAGWSGYTGLTALSLGVTLLLATGIVMAWAVGREFTDGTVVGLFAIPVRRGELALAKMAACLAWGAGLSLLLGVVAGLGGIALGLPVTGAAACSGVVLLVGTATVVSALPVAWVATRWAAYLAGIGATLAIVVVTNLASGFGLGIYVPWAMPVLWATPGAGVGPGSLLLPFAAGLGGAWACHRAWSRLELGRA